MMVHGRTVRVLRPVQIGNDHLGNPTYGEPVPEVVHDVLVQSPTTDDMEAARAEGVTLALTLQFPITYASSLRGCEIEVPEPNGGTYRVVGDPRPDPHAPHRFGNRWNRAVRVEVGDG